MTWKTKEEMTEYNRAYRLKNADALRAKKRAKYYENVEASRAAQRQWRVDNPLRAMQIDLKSQAKERATAQNVPFDIELDDIIVPKACPILGIPLFRNDQPYAHDNSPTLDKIVPEKGYVKGNIAVISHRANSLKGNFTLEEFIAVVEYIESYGK